MANPKTKRVKIIRVLENATNPSDMKLKLQGIGGGSTQENVNKNSLDDIFELKDTED